MSGIHLALLGMTFGDGLPAIGSAYEGGFFAGQISTTGNGIATHNLVVSPKSSGQNNSIQWKTSNTSTASADSVIDGPGNSASMNNASHPAAQFCEGLTIGGYSDWYMPAQNELQVCYYKLKPTTENNDTSAGPNANAVPTLVANYTAGRPAQTSSSDFRNSGAQAFNGGTYPDAEYWAGTNAGSTDGIIVRFSDGALTSQGKVNTFRVRAIRRVAV